MTRKDGGNIPNCPASFPTLYERLAPHRVGHWTKEQTGISPERQSGSLDEANEVHGRADIVGMTSQVLSCSTESKRNVEPDPLQSRP